MATNIGALMVQLLLDDEDFDLEKPRKDLEAFGRQLDDFANAVDSAFIGAAKAVAVGAAGVVAASAVIGASFEAQMTKVGVIAGATGDEFQQLEDKARELGATTAFSATEAAGAMELLASSGLGVSQILAATADTLALAGAGGTDLNTAASALTSTMAQFGLQAEDSARIADVFAKATAATQFQVDDLNEAMKYGGTVGAGFGWSLEQTVAALGMFRDLGLQGSMAGSALRSAMVGAASANSVNVKTLEKYGLTLADISPDTKSFAEILLAVGNAGLTTSDAMIVFGTEAGGALNTLAKSAAEGSNKYNELVASLENAAGTSAAMYGAMQDNVTGSFKEFQSALEEGMLTLFDAFGGPLQSVLDALTDKVGVVVEYFRANSAGITAVLEKQAGALIGWLTKNQQTLAVAFTNGAKAAISLVDTLGRLLPLLDEATILLGTMFVAKQVHDFGAAFITLVSGVRAFVTALVSANATLTVTTGGMWAAVVAIGAVVAAIGLLAVGSDDLVGGLESVSSAIGLDLVGALDRATVAWGAFTNGMREAIQIQPALERLDYLLTPLLAKFARMVELVTGRNVDITAWNLLGGAIGTIADVLLTKVVRGFELVAGVLDVILSIWRPINLSVSMFIEGIMGIVTGSKSAESALMHLFGGVSGLIVSLVNMSFQLIAGSLESILRLITQAVSGIPGIDQFLDLTESLGADIIARERQNFEGEVLKTIASLSGAKKAVGTANAELATFSKGVEKAGGQIAETYGPSGPISSGLTQLGKDTDELAAKQASGAAATEASWKDAFGNVLASAADTLRRQIQLLEDVGADEEEALRLKHEREQAELERAQAAALSEVEDSLVARMLVEGQFAQARKAMDERQAIEAKNLQWAQTKAEMDARKRATQQRVQEHSKALGAVVALERENMGDLERFDAEVQDFFRENAMLTTEERARAEAAFLVQRQELLAQEAEAAAKAAQDEEQARKDKIRAIISVARNAVQSIGAVVGAVTNGVQRAAQSVGAFLGGLVDFSKKVVDSLGNVFGALTGGVASVNALGFLSQAMDSISSGDSTGSVGDVAAQFVAEMGANAQSFLDGVITGLPTVIGALMEQIPILVQAVATALPALAQQLAALVPGLVQVLAENVPVIVQGLVQALPVVVQALATAIPALVQILAENIPVLVQAVVDNLAPLVSAIADAIPAIVQVIAENVPVVVSALVAALPEMVDALIASLPFVVDAFVTSLPILIDGVIEQVPRIITAIMGAMPAVAGALADALSSVLGAVGDIVGSILGALPQVITGIIGSIPQILTAVFEAIPAIVEQVIANLPAIVQALLEGVLAIIVRIAEELPLLISRIIELVPVLIQAIVGMLPDVITAVLAAIPQIIMGLIHSLPRILQAIILLIPQLVVAIIGALPEIIKALVVGLVTQVLFNIPEIAAALAVGLFQALKDAFIALGRLIVNAIKAVFKIGDSDGKKGADGKDDGWIEDTAETVGSWFKKDKGSRYSGISYVPATMRGVTLHKGEAVLTAPENAGRLFGGAAGANQSNPGAPIFSGGGGQTSSVEALFAVDGRIVDGVLVRANANGKGEIMNAMRRRAGVQAGVKTNGRKNNWSR